MKLEKLSDLVVAYLPLDSLIAHSNNARTHSKHQIRQIAASIKAFGFTNPILIDRTNTIIAGHGRVSAAALLGLNQVPTIRLESLSQEQIRAYILADNKLAENAGWDQSILAVELQHLLTIETDLDITITGFEIPEVDLILQEAAAKTDRDEAFEIDEAHPPVTRSGDLWLLGKHQLLCGNALDEASYKALMPGRQRAELVFVDPPYNVAIDGHASGNGQVRHREFLMASGEMNEAEFVAFLTTSLRLLARHSTEGSVHFICMDWRHKSAILP